MKAFGRISFRRPALLLAALLCLTLTVSLVASASAPAAEKGVVVRDALRGGTTAQDVRQYWTAERMREAKPVELNRPPPEGTTASRARTGLDTGIERRAIEVPDTTSFPARTHGKVFFTLGSTNWVCSGTVVSTAVQSVVFTAGHCVNDPDVWGWAKNWSFVPGYRDGNAPFGEFVANELWSLNGWVQDGIYHYDLGAAVVGTNGSGQKVEGAVGARWIAFNQDRNQLYTSWGYPAAPPFTGGLLYTCVSGLVEEDFDPGEPPAPISIYCDMGPGSSGGGWVIGNRYVNSLNSTRNPETSIMSGPYFGNDARNLYADVCGCNLDTTPPDTTITSGPSGTVRSALVSFAFVSTEGGSSFECRLDSGRFAACASPKTYTGLADRSHTFEVRATDASPGPPIRGGNRDTTPASRSFAVDAFRLGKVKRNMKMGTAKLTVIVPGPGALELTKTKKVKGKEKTAEGAGKKKLPIKPRGKAKKELDAKGKSKVRAEVTFTPTGGTPSSQSKKIELVMRSPAGAIRRATRGASLRLAR